MSAFDNSVLLAATEKIHAALGSARKFVEQTRAALAEFHQAPETDHDAEPCRFMGGAPRITMLGLNEARRRAKAAGDSRNFRNQALPKADHGWIEPAVYG
jgi:hypothetical protein